MTVVGALQPDGTSSGSIVAIEETADWRFLPDDAAHSTVGGREMVSAPRDIMYGLPVAGIDGLTTGRIAVMGRGVDLHTVTNAAAGLTVTNGHLAFDAAHLPAGFSAIYTGTSRTYGLLAKPATRLRYDGGPIGGFHLWLTGSNVPDFDPKAVIWVFPDATIGEIDGKTTLRSDNDSYLLTERDGVAIAVRTFHSNLGVSDETIARSVHRVSASEWEQLVTSATGRTGRSAIAEPLPPN